MTKLLANISSRSRVSWLDLYHTTYSGVSALVAGSDILRDLLSDIVFGYLTVRPIVWQRFFRALASPKVLPDSQGFPKFSEGLLWDCERCPGKFDSYHMLFLSRDEEGFISISTLSLTGF